MASLAKWLSVRLRTKWLWVQITLLSLKLQIWRLLRARSSLTFRQTRECRFTLKLVHDMIITHSQKSPAYLFQVVAENNTAYTTRSVQKSQFPFFKTKTNFFKNSLFPGVIMEWNKIDVNIRNPASCNVFKKVLLKFIRPEPNQAFRLATLLKRDSNTGVFL